jgi:hypothetical protein
VPREVRDLIAPARNSWIVCFHNLSHLPEELADAACRVAIGGGFGGRELYSDRDEAIFDATRPMVFNAIPDLAAACQDFLDRAVIVEFLDLILRKLTVSLICRQKPLALFTYNYLTQILCYVS